MLKKRLIAVIIVTNNQVVQSIKFKHTNIVHYDAIHAVEAFSNWSVDEIVILNVDRSPENKSQFVETISEVSRYCFIPITVGGWITDQDYAQELLRNGADKLCLNTALEKDSGLVTGLAKKYGKQCIVASIDVKKEGEDAFVYIDRGSCQINVRPNEWAMHAQQLGAGEILFNSIDHDGARRGYDLETLKVICDVVDVPVIGFGGVFTWKHLLDGINVGCDAVAVANQFHYQEHSTRRAKTYLANNGVAVRQEGRELN